MTSGLIRSVVATIVGIVVAFGLILLFQYASANLFPAGYDAAVYDVAAEEIEAPLGTTIALIIGWFVGTFAGGWLAMRASGGSGAGWVVAGSVMGAAIYRASSPVDEWWIFALAVLVPAAAAWLAQRATGFATPATA